MASFAISKPYTMDKQEVRDGAELLASEMKRRHGLNYRWRGDRATFSRSGISGTLSLDNNTIEVEVKLGMMASAFERPIRHAIVDFLDEYVT